MRRRTKARRTIARTQTRAWAPTITKQQNKEKQKEPATRIKNTNITSANGSEDKRKGGSGTQTIKSTGTRKRTRMRT
jgi:hypothetical protein